MDPALAPLLNNVSHTLFSFRNPLSAGMPRAEWSGELCLQPEILAESHVTPRCPFASLGFAAFVCPVWDTESCLWLRNPDLHSPSELGGETRAQTRQQLA